MIKEFNQSQIKEILPHRGPVAFIEKIELLSEAEANSYFSVDATSELIRGHFEAAPMLPGTFIVEAMAQTAGFLLLQGNDKKEAGLPLLLGISNMRFITPAKPDCEIKIHAVIKSQVSPVMADFKVEAFSDELRIASGTLSMVLS